VLEIGCGTGTTALQLAPVVARYLATDVSGRMIEIGREKAAVEPVDGLGFDRLTLFDDRLKAASFDAVLAFNLLHLVEDLDAAARRVHALLRPGGRFVSKTLCLGERLHVLRLALPVARVLGLAPYVRSMTIAELEGALTRAGFEIVETGVFPKSPPSRFVVAEKR
jgi:SAM-dependent methyltransferase